MRSKILHLGSLLLLIAPASAVVVFDNGMNNVVNSTINDSVDVIDGPGDLATTVIFEAGVNSGDPDPDFAAVILFESSIATINSGSFSNSFVATEGSTLNMAGGFISNNLIADSAASITISDGVVGNDLILEDDAILFMSGGVIADDLQIFSPTASAVITGGTITEDIQVDGLLELFGGNLLAQDLNFGLATLGGQINIYGSDFAIDGVPVGLGDVLPENGILSGTLSNGDPINILIDRNPIGSIDPTEIGTITLIPEPSSALLVGLGSLVLLRRRR